MRRPRQRERQATEKERQSTQKSDDRHQRGWSLLRFLRTWQGMRIAEPALPESPAARAVGGMSERSTRRHGS
jgi:hypothetical protein